MNILTETYREAKENKSLIIVILAFTLLAYGLYFALPIDLAAKMAVEDGPYEYVTAFLFLSVAIILFKSFLVRKNYLLLLLSGVFLLGFGEEISWGQRIFNYETPEIIAEKNRQHESNLHNLEIFHEQDTQGHSKEGLQKLLTVNFLYNVFWFSWCVLLPIAILTLGFLKLISDKIHLPVPALAIGLLFILNFGIFYFLRSFISLKDNYHFYAHFREVYECVSSIIFVGVSLDFLRREKSALKGF